MNILSLVGVSIGSAKSRDNFNRHLIQGPEAGFIDRIKAAAKNKIEGYIAQARRERGTEQVLQMSDSELKDIGLTKTDRYSLKSGLTSLAELNARREANRRKIY